MTALARPLALCRSWLFLPGAERETLMAAPECGADVLIQELEDFTPRDRRSEAGGMAPDIYKAWRGAGAVVAVRVNPLDDGGIADLEAVMRGAPDVVMLPKVRGAADIEALAEAIGAFEARYGISGGSTLLVPNIESAAALMQVQAIAQASPRVTGCLLASEDLAADLGAERTPDSDALDHARQRFLLECRAAGKLAIDCPFTWADADYARADAQKSRRWGFGAKSAVAATHAAIINEVMTPSQGAVAEAQRIVDAFEAARSQGLPGVPVDGNLVEMPTYLAARRLLERHAALSKAAR